ncbi:MAG: DNA translocase FtsK, partial [Oscillospiraceae bacterium]|nr:DNA translocase FtsK [Oscillospiraceae bacterium]
ITLLERPSGGAKANNDALTAKAEKLEETLQNFHVNARVVQVTQGPTVTRYEIQPAIGVKVNSIVRLADDIALNLEAKSIRIEAPIPGKAAVGIEVENDAVTMVRLREIIDSEEFKKAKSKITFAVGKDISGNAIVADLKSMPHLLIAGSTGSGKSVCVNAIITSFLYKSSPEDVKLILIDPKVVELAEYNGIPHLLMPVVTEPKKAAGALGSAVAEMEKRYKLFAETGVREIKSYNKLAETREDLEKLPYVAIIIDELADLMMVAGKEVEDYICRIAQKARAAGMHLIVATQRPSVDVITGLIKANIPARIAFAVSSQIDSRTILDGGGAEKLLGMGDMLFLPLGASKPIRVQGTYVKDGEIEKVIDFIKQDYTADYNQEMITSMENIAAATGSKGGAAAADGADQRDEMTTKAIEVVVDAGQASTSLLQRKLKLGYARAARIMDEMEEMGIIGPYEGSKPRQVLITKNQWLEMMINNSNEQ